MATGNAILAQGGEWPEVRRQLEALLLIGMYSTDAHTRISDCCRHLWFSGLVLSVEQLSQLFLPWTGQGKRTNN